MKYCETCGKENYDSSEMCIDCGGLTFANDKLQINRNPNKIISILCFIFPLIGIIIVLFCEISEKRKIYRNCALAGVLFYLIFGLINRCIVEKNYDREINKMIEEIHNRGK